MNVFDYAIIVLTFLIVAIVGYKSRTKNASSNDFILASKSINKLQAGFSMAATDFGGSGLVAAIGYCYVVGMSGSWWNLAAAPAFLFVGLYLAEKINKMGATTVPEYLGKRYSVKVRILATIMHVFTNIATLSVQYTVACTMLYSITGIPINISLAICVVFVVLLTSGGLRSVVNTDSVLFVIIVMTVLIAVLISVSVAGGLLTMTSNVESGTFSFTKIGFWTPFSWFILCMLNYSTNQNYVQRMIAAKNEGTARFGACFTAGFYLIISICIGIIGISAALAMPNISNTNTVFPELLSRYFPHGLLGIGIAGVFAATVSTGTSILHSTTTLFVNDVLEPLRANKNNDRNEFKYARLITLLVAAFSMIISLFSDNIISVIYMSGLFYGVSVFFPMILGMKTKRIGAAAVLLSMILTVICSLLWEYLVANQLPTHLAIPSNLVGLIVSLLVLLISLAKGKPNTEI